MVINQETVEEIRFELFLKKSFEGSNNPVLIYSEVPFSDIVLDQIFLVVNFNRYSIQRYFQVIHSFLIKTQFSKKNLIK
jgi:hypothetical protein